MLGTPTPTQAPAPSPPEPASVRAEPTTTAAVEPAATGRLLASSNRVLAYVNRTHATTFEILSEISRAGPSLAYLIQDAGGREAQLTWNHDSARAQGVPLNLAPPRESEGRPGPEGRPQVAGTSLVEMASGRTPIGYPCRLDVPTESAHRDCG
ncbi:MAG: hypothetical protein ACRDNS_06250 [Trebonia sp.]